MRRLVAVAVVLAVVASLMTYATFSTVLRNGVTPATNGVDDLSVTTVKLRVPQPTLIIKVNEEERVRMKDPFTRDAARLFTGMFAGQPEGVYWRYNFKNSGDKAELYSTTLPDLWDITVPTSNITLTTYSFSYSDNGTALMANITFTGLSPIAINISSIALRVSITNWNSYTVSFVPLATNLPSPLVLGVNDSIVVQWIITLNYGGNDALRNAFMWFINELALKGQQYANSGDTVVEPEIFVGNGTSTTQASTENFIVNTSIPNHAYITALAYFDSSVANPTYLVMKALNYNTGWHVVFNESVAGLGADRAVLVKIDVSFG